MTNTHLRQQVQDARFAANVKAARQRRFVAGCAQNGNIYSRAQHQPRTQRFGCRSDIPLQLLAIVLGMIVVGAIATLVLIVFGVLPL